MVNQSEDTAPYHSSSPSLNRNSRRVIGNSARISKSLPNSLTASPEKRHFGANEEEGLRQGVRKGVGKGGVRRSQIEAEMKGQIEGFLSFGGHVAARTVSTRDSMYGIERRENSKTDGRRIMTNMNENENASSDDDEKESKHNNRNENKSEYRKENEKIFGSECGSETGSKGAERGSGSHSDRRHTQSENVNTYTGSTGMDASRLYRIPPTNGEISNWKYFALFPSTVMMFNTHHFDNAFIRTSHRTLLGLLLIQFTLPNCHTLGC